MAGLIAEIVQLAGTYAIHTALLVFVLCLLGEGIGVGAPYVLEATWLVVGYRVTRGLSPVAYALLLVLMAQVGRQVGAYVFCQTSRLVSRPFSRLSHAPRLGRLCARSSAVVASVNVRSPFAVALGRLVGLRIPLTLLLGATRQWRALAFGILMSSLVFDGTYLVLGAVVGQRIASPVYLLPCFLLGLAIMYGMTLLFRTGGRRLLEALPEATTAEPR